VDREFGHLRGHPLHHARPTNSPRRSCPENCDAHEDDDSAEEVAQMNPVRARDGQRGLVDGRDLHDHDCAAENDEERTKPPLH
jgi:hypothetical protein